MADTSMDDSNPDSASRTDSKTTNTLGEILWAFAVLSCSHVVRALSSICLEILDSAVPVYELNLLRFSLLFAVLTPVVIKKKLNIFVPRQKLPLLLILAVVSTNVHNICYYVASHSVAFITLGAMVAGIAIAFNMILTICIPAERSIHLYFGGVTALLGLVLVAQPSCLFHHITPYSVANDTILVLFNWTSPCWASGLGVPPPPPAESSVPPESALLVLIASIFLVCQTNTLPAAMQDVQHPIVIGFWTAIMGSVLSALLMLLFEDPVLLTSPLCIGLVVIHCVGVQQSLLTVQWSIQYLSPSVLTMAYGIPVMVELIGQYVAVKYITHPFDYCRIFGAVLCGIGVIGGPLCHMVAPVVRTRAARRYQDGDEEEKCGLLTESKNDNSDSLANSLSFLHGSFEEILAMKRTGR